MTLATRTDVNESGLATGADLAALKADLTRTLVITQLTAAVLCSAVVWLLKVFP